MGLITLILVLTTAVGVWRWRKLVRRARAREIGRVSAWARFVLVAFGPLVFGAALLLIAVAFEEATARVVVSERAILLLVPFVALGALASAAFGLRLLALRPTPRDAADAPRTGEQKR